MSPCAVPGCRDWAPGAGVYCVDHERAGAWVVKRGRYEYVFADAVEPLEWTDEQTLAHRFVDRNAAAHVIGRMPAGAEDVRVVRLVPRGGT